MKFIMVSREGDGCHILHMIECEGNEVQLYITEKSDKDMWEGILPKVDHLPLDKEAIYIFDSSGNAKIADDLIRKGYYVVGSCGIADKLEFDRGFGIDIMDAIGMKVPMTETFKTFKETIEFLEEHKGRYVFKPSGKGLPCHLSYCPAEDEDILPYVKYIEKSYGKDIDEIEIQEFIEGTAISTEGWFNGYHFVEPFNHTLEKKKFLNDDFGPATGCAGNLVWLCEYDKELRKLEPYIQGYIGPMDINRIYNKKGQYGLEWTPRHGYDAICALLKLFNGDIGKFYSDLARHQFEGEIPLDDKMSAALRVTIPPYPVDDVEIKPGLPLEGIDEDSDDYYFYEIAYQDDKLVHCGSSGVVLCTLGVGNNAMNHALECADDLIIPNKQYRTDLVEIFNKEYKEFEEVAYA